MWYLYEHETGHMYGPFAHETDVRSIIQRTGERFEPVFMDTALSRRIHSG